MSQAQYREIKAVSGLGAEEEKEESEWVRAAVAALDSIDDRSWLAWAGEELMPRVAKGVRDEEDARMQEEAAEAGRQAEAEAESARLAQAQKDDA